MGIPAMGLQAVLGIHTSRGGGGGVGLTPRTSAVSSSRFCALSGTDSSLPTGSFFCSTREEKPRQGLKTRTRR